MTPSPTLPEAMSWLRSEAHGSPGGVCAVLAERIAELEAAPAEVLAGLVEELSALAAYHRNHTRAANRAVAPGVEDALALVEAALGRHGAGEAATGGHQHELLMNDVHKAVSEAGIECVDTREGALCDDVASYLLECGWRHPALPSSPDHATPEGDQR